MAVIIRVILLLLIPSLAYPWVYREQFNGATGAHTVGQTFEPGGNMSCYVTSSKGEAGVITDSTTLDPTQSLYIKFYSGEEDSAEIVSCSSDYEIPVGTTQMYVQWKFKYATSWMLHPDYDKQLYFKDVNSTPVFTVGIRDPSSYPYPVITKGSNSTTGDGYRYPNVTGTEIVFGRWYTADLWIKFGTPGAANGEFKLWVNGVLQSHYTGVITLGSGSVRTKYFSLTPVWGGNQTLVAPRDMYKYFDDIIWSNEPITGGTIPDTNDAVPPYVSVSSRTPDSNATGVDNGTNISVSVLDSGDGVNSSTITMTVNGSAVTPTITGTSANYTVSYNPPTDFAAGQTVSVSVNACDLADTPNCMAASSWTFTTAFADTPGTGTKTKAQLLAYLSGLKDLPTKKLISGQRAESLGNYESGDDKEFTDVGVLAGGKLPALIGFDFSCYPDLATCSYDAGVARAIEHWNAGGLVHFTWHSANPANNNVWSWPLQDPYFMPFSDVYTPGYTVYENFRAQLVKVGDAIQDLEDNNVVISFAPFHEMNNHNATTSFWWDGRSASDYVRLWEYTRNYLEVERGLSNILWVYAITRFYNPTEYYPGDNNVDIVGIDYYSVDGSYDGSDSVNSNALSYYNTLRSSYPDKPFVFSETGLCLTTDGQYGGRTDAECDGNDAREIVNDISTSFPDAVWFMFWDDEDITYGLANQSYVSELMSDQRVVTLADNPSGATADNSVAISTTTLPNATVGTEYAFTLAAVGGATPYTWDNVGVLPPGVSIPSTGSGSWGSPTAAGTYPFSLRVSDSSGGSAYSDDFNRDSESPMAGNWTQASTSNPISISGNQLQTAETTYNRYAWRNSESYHADQYSQAKNTTASWTGELGGPAVRSRMNGSEWNGYFATIIDSNTIQVYAAYGTPVAYAQIGADCDGTLAPNDNVYLSAVDNTLTVKINGTTLCTRGDTNNRLPSGGAPGIMVYGTTARWDDWSGWDTSPLTNTDTQAVTLKVNPKTPGGQVTTTSFTLADTYVNGGAATTNYSDNTFNRTYTWPLGSPRNRTLVQVASLGLPENISVTSATLYMYLPSTGGYDGSGGTNPANIYVYPVTGQSWTIANVTWNTLDNAAVGTYESVTAVPLTAGWYSWTVTEMTKAAYAADGALTVLLDGGLDGAADTNRYFTSMDGTEAQRPYLSVTYTLLTPGGVPVSAPGRMRISRGKLDWR